VSTLVYPALLYIISVSLFLYHFYIIIPYHFCIIISVSFLYHYSISFLYHYSISFFCIISVSLFLYHSYIIITVAIKSIRRSQVTGLLNLTKGHTGHRSQREVTNSFFGLPKRLPKGPKSQKFAPGAFSAMRMVH